MGGYEVLIETLRVSSRSARSAADQASGTDLAAAVDGFRTGMPGGRAAASATPLGNNWHAELANWVRSMTEYADAVTAAADSYAASEEAADQAFRPVPGGMRAI